MGRHSRRGQSKEAWAKAKQESAELRDSAAERLNDRVAFHEAGHAVADVVLGKRFVAFSMAQVVRKDRFGKSFIGTEGMVWIEEDRQRHRREQRAGIIDHANSVCLMAGPMAEAMLVGMYDGICADGAHGDLAAIELAVANRLGVEKAWNTALMKETVRRAQTQATMLLTAHWPSVEKVAELLKDRRRLTYEEVLAAMRLAEEELDPLLVESAEPAETPCGRSESRLLNPESLGAVELHSQVAMTGFQDSSGDGADSSGVDLGVAEYSV